jgi:DNA gyrase/topoisomerase IV subunit A
LSSIIKNANAELQECRAQMQKNLKYQHEIRAFYQNQLKHLTKQYEQREKEFLEKLAG